VLKQHPLHLLFVIGDAGGFSVLRPIIKHFKIGEHQIEVLVNKTFSEIIPRIMIENPEYRILDNESYVIFSNLSRDQRPDIAVITVSRAGNLEKRLVKKARSLNIPTVSPIENWGPFAGRFSDIESGQFKNHMAYLPDHVLVVDEFAKTQAISERVPKDCISVIGSIPIESIIKKPQNYEKSTLKKIKLGLGGGNNQKVVVFASQALRNEMGLNSPEYAGYDETEVLSDICEALSRIWPNCLLVVKLHPFERIEEFKKPLSLGLIKHTIIKEMPSSEIIAVGDLIIGMISGFLIEASIKNKLVVSYQKSIKTKTKFVGSALDLMYFCNNVNQLERLLKRSPKPLLTATKYYKKISNGATNRIISFIENVGR
tara:strand:+ start:691 stop:1803 length:1113 start_codon:yes stop_codon:yes gene_type:complete